MNLLVACMREMNGNPLFLHFYIRQRPEA